MQLTALFGCSTALQQRASQQVPFLVYYSSEADLSTLRNYPVLVLDPQAYPNVSELHEQTVLGYVSLGEAEPNELGETERHLALQENPVWKSDLVDVRHADWQAKILQDKVPSVLQKGYSGVMLDTVDSAIYLEQTEPEKFAGMSAAVIQLIGQIHQQYPQAKIMLNRGMEIWPQVAPSIDMILVESVLTDYDFDKQQAYPRTQAEYTEQMRQIRTIAQQYPHLKFYSVDYWDMNDDKGVSMIYRTQRKNNVTPYVSTPDLNTVYPEPNTSPWPSMENQRALYGGSDA